MRKRFAANSLSDLSAVVLLFVLNAWIAWRLFWVEYTPHFNSVEGSFIGLARYMSRHFGHFSWWPLWHCGMPYQDTYVPLVHLSVALTSMASGLSAARSYHFVTAVAYCLAPVTLYWMARMLGAERVPALFSAIVLSVFSPCAVMFPEYARDLGSIFLPRRLQVLLVYGEGPHVTAIASIPIVILALENAFAKRTRRSFALAALAMALVFVTNVPGTMALGLAVFCWISIHHGDLRAAWKIAGGAAALGYVVACFGVPPSAIATVFGNAGAMHSGFSRSLHTPYLLPLVFAAAGGCAWLLGRLRVPRFVAFGGAYLALTTLLVWTARDSKKFELLPQVGRMHLELELGAALLLGWVAWLFYQQRLVRYAMLGFGALVLYHQIDWYRMGANTLLPQDDLASHSEYTSAKWVRENLGDRRIYATGSTGFWLNAFTDTPQVIGCCDQGRTMVALAAVPYLVHAGVSPEKTRLAITWLQAMGANAIIVNGPESGDDYKDYVQPERFEGVVPALHREHGDVIYRIPQQTDSLAHVLHPGEATAVQPTGLATDADVVRYVAAIEDPMRPQAQCDWSDPAHARIRANLATGDMVSVQVAYFRGWKAMVRGASRPVQADGIGFMLIQPQCQGDCEIDLEWTGPSDLYVSAFVSIVGLAIVALLTFPRVSRTTTRT
ncbi:MAG TPA: hypothetical protein VKE70_16035 [Candidatus Solibacter sp.]|nr:hypothetical protein [Candidatus Solibacter sp.]